MKKAENCGHCGGSLTHGGEGLVASFCHQCQSPNSLAKSDPRRCPSCGFRDTLQAEYQSWNSLSCICSCGCSFRAPLVQSPLEFKGWNIIKISPMAGEDPKVGVRIIEVPVFRRYVADPA